MPRKSKSGVCECCGNKYKKWLDNSIDPGHSTNFGEVTPCPHCRFDPKIWESVATELAGLRLRIEVAPNGCHFYLNTEEAVKELLSDTPIPFAKGIHREKMDYQYQLQEAIRENIRFKLGETYSGLQVEFESILAAVKKVIIKFWPKPKEGIRKR